MLGFFCGVFRLRDVSIARVGWMEGRRGRRVRFDKSNQLCSLRTWIKLRVCTLNRYGPYMVNGISTFA